MPFHAVKPIGLLLIGFLLLFTHAMAQPDTAFTRQLVMGADVVSSGNMHGAFFRFFAGFEQGRNLLVAGPLLQIAGNQVNGGRISYSRNVSGSPLRLSRDAKGRRRFDRVQFGYMTYAQYVHQARLAAHVIELEERVARGSLKTFDHVRMSTVEAGVAIEVRVNFARNFAWTNCVGLAGHWHTSYQQGLSRGRAGLTLALSTGLLLVMD